MTGTPMTETPMSPGEALQQELDSRHWFQADLAEVIGRPFQAVNTIIKGKKEITRETAAQLGAAFGTTPEHWLKMQDDYRLWLLSQDEAHQRQLEAIRERAQRRPAPVRLNPEDFPGFSPEQLVKLEKAARRIVRDTPAE